MSDLSRTLFQVEVRESDKNRNYWANRPWASASSGIIREADIVVVPWEDFRNGYPALFPHDTLSLFEEIQAGSKLSVAIAVPEEDYKELSLHGRELRWPTLLVSGLILPIIATVLGNRIDSFLTDGFDPDTVEIEIIVEGDFGKCISIKYKGPPNRLKETILFEHQNCFADKGDKIKPSGKGDRLSK